MSTNRCVICWQMVSSERAAETADGEPAHAKCLGPQSPEESLLWDIFGQPGMKSRRAVAPTLVAEQLGHHLRWTGQAPANTVSRTVRRPWACSCGIAGADGKEGRERHVSYVIATTD